MNPASPAQYLVRERLVGMWPVFVWPVYLWQVDVGRGRVPAAGIARSTSISQSCLGADWLKPLQFQ